jgi:CheY-like chemotaxis protein
MKRKNSKTDKNKASAAITVIVVDDSVISRKLLITYIESMGYRVVTASDGAQALEILNSDKVDLALLDLRMPVMDGFETAIAMRSSDEYYADIPVIGLSADAVTELPEKILNAGMNECLIKPVGRDDLEKLLRKWLPDEQPSAVQSSSGAMSISRLRRMLAEELPTYRATIRQNLENSVYADLYEIAHKIAGGSAYCEIPELESAARALQNAISRSDPNALIQHAEQLLEKIDSTLAALKPD